MKNKIISILYFFLFITNLYSQSTYFVKFKEKIAVSQGNLILTNLLKKNNTQHSNINTNQQKEIIHSFVSKFGKMNEQLNRLFKIEINENNSDKILSSLSNNPDVEYIQKAHSYVIDSQPSDSLYSQQWGIDNIKAPDTWDLLNQNRKEILLAVIDTGIDFDHPDLKNKIYQNPGETGVDFNGNDKSSNGIDDDGNGFIDDFQGWDFVNKIKIFPADLKDDFTDWDNIPDDENSHGTNIAGIIGAEHNSFGIAGVDPDIKLLNLRAFDKNGNGEEDDAAAAIIYAVKMGAQVINMSWGDTEYSNVLKDVIQYAYENNVVMVASSGNSASSLPHYPSSLNEVISVGAIQENNALAGFSNFGSTMDLVAPGSQIITTSLDGDYKKVSGTSAAAPFVSGAASIILSLKDFKNEEVKQLIKSTANDLGIDGWDENYGAGGLNLFKAVSLLSPSEIKFNFPEQDYSTSGDSLKINITCVSPYFKDYSIFYGVGYNPADWKVLPVNNKEYQIVNETIYKLDLANLSDTVYTLKLLMNKIDNTTLEERVNFIIDRSPPKILSFNLFPAMLNDVETVQTSVITDDKTTAELFYRKINSNNEFSSISLDGFVKDAKFVSQKHFGFLPADEVLTGIDHEFYIEVTNTGGLKTILKDNDNYFKMSNSIASNVITTQQNNFSLPNGRIFPSPITLGNINGNFVMLNSVKTSTDLSLFSFTNNEFTNETTINKRIPVSVGDFNGDGKTDILSLFVKNGFIETQTSMNSLQFENVYSDTSGKFWPSLAEDIDDDNKFEIIAFADDTTFTISEIGNDFSLVKEAALTNFAGKQSGESSSSFRSNTTLITDFDNDQKKEIVAVDDYGRLLFYQVNGPGSYQNDFIIEPFFPLESNSQITKGDYNGDGKEDIAILIEFQDNVLTTPLIYSAVITLINGELTYLYQNMFISTESNFVSSFTKQYRTLRLHDFDNDGTDELIIFTFPNSYIFKYVDQNNSELIDFKTNVNTQSVFIGDLNVNGITEFSVPDNDNTNFYEFSVNNLPQAPVINEFYSREVNENYIEWENNNLPVYIFRSQDMNDLLLYDSTASNIFIDTNVVENKNYFYSIANYDVIESELTSRKSKIVKIFNHAPVRLVEVTPLNSKNILLQFNGKVDKSNISINNILIDDNIIPNSIADDSQTSLLINIKENLGIGIHSIETKNLRDFYNSPIQDSSFIFNILDNNIDNELIISKFNIINNNNLVIRFNLNLDSLTALDINNYMFSPNNLIEDINFGDSKSEVNIRTKNPFGSIGKEYVLTIKNVYSSVETGYIKISDNSGSQIILTGKAENLDNMYVYPNPVKAAYSKLTFANIPNNIDIYIYDINGIFISKITEEDGNGGVDWNLKDENKQLVQTGIYLYKAISKDNFGETIQEKLGKFAVIK